MKFGIKLGRLLNKTYEKCTAWLKKFWVKTAWGLFIILIAVIFLNIFNHWFYKHDNIRNSSLNLLLTISAAILAFLALLDDFSTFIRTSIFKSTILKVIIILIACDFAWVATDKKDAQSEAKARLQSKTDSVRKVNEFQKDSIRKINESNRDSIKNIARNKLYQDSLKVGLGRIANIFISSLNGSSKKYTEAEQKITQLVRDSSKRENKYISEQGAVLDVSNILLTKRTSDSLYFQIKLTCNHSIAYDLDLPIKIAYLDSKYQLIRYYKDNYQFATLEQLEQDKTRTAFVELPNYDHKKVIIFRISGSYTDYVNRKNKIPFDRILAYNVDSKSQVTYERRELDEFRKKFNE